MAQPDIAVIIVAAGRGTRMGSLTEDRPKSLIPFAGRPLIEWQMSALASLGLTDVTIVGGYRADQLAGYGSRLTINTEWPSTNMVYSLFCAEDVLLSGKTVVVAYADIVYEPHVLAALLERDGEAATVVDRNWLALWRLRREDPLADAETLRLSEDGTILEIGKRPSSLQEIEGQYVGLTKLSEYGARKFANAYRRIGDWMPGKAAATCYFTDVLEGMIGAGTALHAASTSGGWLEFDSADDLAAYETCLANGTLARFWSPERAIAG